MRINNSVFELVFSKFYYLGFLKVQYLGHFCLTYLFINDLYLWISRKDFSNNGNTISTAESTIEKLNSSLEQDSLAAIDWFTINEMTVNPDKF